jgi:hypothetical protein
MFIRHFAVPILAAWTLAAAMGQEVDVSSLTGKVVCGYQGWFRCEGDGSNNGWHHYAAGRTFEPGRATIDMWPDVSELPKADRVPTSFRHSNGAVAEVFSSVRESTVRLHFQWMKNYGIDGVFLQRFATTAADPRFRGPMDQVLDHCRTAAKASGRGWALMYDLTGMRPGCAAQVMEDVKQLIRGGRLPRGAGDARYFRHRGRPLIALWGLGFNDRAPMLDDWERIVRFLKSDPEWGGYCVMLGVPCYWRTLDRDTISDPRLHDIMALGDVISPWSVGRFGTAQDAAARVEKLLKPDIARAAEMKSDYLPVIFPGFSWHNLYKSRGKEAKLDAIPRRGGQFLWSQAVAAKSAGATMLYVAMFDEMDESTAIFKTNPDPPVGASPFLSEKDVPPDRYLWLTGQIRRMLEGTIPPSGEMPRQPPVGNARP